MSRKTSSYRGSHSWRGFAIYCILYCSVQLLSRSVNCNDTHFKFNVHPDSDRVSCSVHPAANSKNKIMIQAFILLKVISYLGIHSLWPTLIGFQVNSHKNVAVEIKFFFSYSTNHPGRVVFSSNLKLFGEGTSKLNPFSTLHVNNSST